MSMSPDEIAEAQKELLQMFSPEQLSTLKNLGKGSPAVANSEIQKVSEIKEKIELNAQPNLSTEPEKPQ